MVKHTKNNSDPRLEKLFMNLELEIARFRVNLAKKTDKEMLYSGLAAVIAAFKKLNNNIDMENSKAPLTVNTAAKKPKKKATEIKPAKIGLKRLLKNIDKDL